MTIEEQKDFENILKSYLDDPAVRRMEDYCAHGTKTVYSHCEDVAKAAFLFNRRLHLKADEKVLLTGALLHDYYLYDWHQASIRTSLFKMHGFTHPFTARDNARRDFGINDEVAKVISCHMWPLTFRSFPSSKEALIVCLVDKYCALRETLKRW